MQPTTKKVLEVVIVLVLLGAIGVGVYFWRFHKSSSSSVGYNKCALGPVYTCATNDNYMKCFNIKDPDPHTNGYNEHCKNTGVH